MTYSFRYYTIISVCEGARLKTHTLYRPVATHDYTECVPTDFARSSKTFVDRSTVFCYSFPSRFKLAPASRSEKTAFIRNAKNLTNQQNVYT